MAYRRRTSARRSSSYSRPARRVARRSTRRASPRRVSQRPQTVRIVLEQAAPSLSRMPAASNLIGLKAAPKPQTAKL